MAKKSGGKLAFVLVAVIICAVAGTFVNGTKNEAVTVTAPVESVAPSTATPRPLVIRNSPATKLAQYEGYAPAISEDDGPLRCDYTVQTTKKATINWTDGVQAYTITGASDALSRLYIEMLGVEAWESCLYSIKRHPAAGYGTSKVSNACATIDAYTAQMRETLNVKPTPAPTPIKNDYVLNNNTKVFHWPSCPHASRIGRKNRQDVTTTRDNLISKGYSPCGNCKP